MPNMISIGLKAQKLLRYHCSYHGNLVTIAEGIMLRGGSLFFIRGLPFLRLSDNFF